MGASYVRDWALAGGPWPWLEGMAPRKRGFTADSPLAARARFLEVTALHAAWYSSSSPSCTRLRTSLSTALEFVLLGLLLSFAWYAACDLLLALCSCSSVTECSSLHAGSLFFHLFVSLAALLRRP